MRRPADYLPAFEEALRETVANQDPSFAKTMPLSTLKIGLSGSFGSHHVSPRGLGAPLLNTAVCVEGIVTKCAARGRSRPAPTDPLLPCRRLRACDCSWQVHDGASEGAALDALLPDDVQILPEGVPRSHHSWWHRDGLSISNERC